MLASSEELDTRQELKYHAFRKLMMARVHRTLAADSEGLLCGQCEPPSLPVAFNVSQYLQEILQVYRVNVSSWPTELQILCPSLGSALHDEGFCKPCVRL